MTIELDFNILTCDKGHISDIDSKVCSVCGDILINSICGQKFYEKRKAKLNNVFTIIQSNRERIKKLEQDIEENNVKLIRYEDQNEFELNQIGLIQESANNPVFDNLCLTNESISQYSFLKTEKLLLDFFNELYVPITNILTFDITYSYRKNTIERLLLLAQKAEQAYVTFLESAIQESQEKAEILQKRAQVLLDELIIESSLLNRIYNSVRIGNISPTFREGDNNYSAIAAMFMFNKPVENVNDISVEIKRDTLYYFRDYIQKAHNEISFENILSIVRFKHDYIQKY